MSTPAATSSPAIDARRSAPSVDAEPSRGGANPPRGVVITDFPLRAPRLKGLLPWMGRTFLSATGWTLVGGAPDVPQMVLVGYPHTSNWDLPYMLASGWGMGFWPSWFGKDSLFKGPFGGMMRALKGIGVDRGSANNVVEQLVGYFAREPELMLMVPVEGTRSYKDHWRSGFYYIAHGAQVPIALTHLDYSRKRTGIQGMIYTSGDVRADMEAIRAHYEAMDARGRYPDLANPIRLKDEEAGRG